LADLISNSLHVSVLGSSFDLKAYYDSDYAGCNLDKKSTSGGCQILRGNQLADYDVLYDKVLIFCDNTSAIAISNNSVLHSRTKHIDISCTALTKEPSAMYIEYLKDFWYTAEVDDATKDISFSLSLFENQLSFNRFDFLTAIGLNDNKSIVPLHPKVTVRAGLATLGLADKDKPSLTSTELVNSSPLKLKYFLPIWKIFMQYIVKCLGGMKGSHDQMNFSQQTIAYCLIFGLEINIGDIIFKDQINKLQNGKKNRETNTPSKSEVSLTSHMLKVAKLSKEPDESLILPSEEVNAEATADKSQSGTNVQPLSQPKAPTAKKSKKKKILSSTQPKVSNDSREMNPPSTTTHIQATKEFLVIAVPIQSLEASVTVEVQDNHLKVADTTEVLEKNVEKDYLSRVQDHTINDYKESTGIQEDSDSDLQSMPDDDLRSVSGFEAANSDDTHDNEVSHSAHTSQDDIASVEHLSIPDHLEHICEEVSYLHSRLGNMESSIVQTVSDEIKSSLPAIITNALKEQLPGILSATLKDCLPLILNRQFNISHVAQSKRFVTLQKELSKVIKSEVAKKVQVVRLEGVREDLQSQTKHISKYSSSFQNMQTQLQDVKDLLESTGEHKTAENITPHEPSLETQEELPFKESTLTSLRQKLMKNQPWFLYNLKKDW
ncbi:retrovirus-related pol polyprotein from transposon TNT 1-94, partial [Tanacetum coccineum]